MALILGIETSCDETAASVYDSANYDSANYDSANYDSANKQILSSVVFSQILLHEKYGGVVPEIASRSHLEKIGFIVRQALQDSGIDLSDIDHIAVTNKPGLAGALLIGLCFAKSLAWSNNKNLISVDHLEAHIFSSFINDDGTVRSDIKFPHICLVASGGHSSLFYVEDFGKYRVLGQTLDDAVGEAFDKVAKLVGLGYPGGPRIEKLAQESGFEDFFSYPRTKKLNKILDFSFSGIKTAVLYDLIKRGAYELNSGIISNKMTPDLQSQVSSSLLVCISDIVKAKVNLALKSHPEVERVTFTGGVACNKFLCSELNKVCDARGVSFVVPSPKYCSDNGAMVALVGGYKAEQKKFAEITLDVFE